MPIQDCPNIQKFAIEGTGASGTEVEAFSGRMDETSDGKKMYSAMIKIATKHAKPLSHNSGYKGVSFKLKLEGKEWEADIKTGPQLKSQWIGRTKELKLQG